MREFFTGWRRKAGCIALVMACVLMAGWARSADTFDFVGANGRLSRVGIESVCGRIKVIRTSPLGDPNLFNFTSGPVEHLEYVKTTADGKHELIPALGSPTWRLDWIGFHTSVGDYPTYSSTIRMSVLIVPYWAVVLPLTLLSAYLILWKPRKRKAESDA